MYFLYKNVYQSFMSLPDQMNMSFITLSKLIFQSGRKSGNFALPFTSLWILNETYDIYVSLKCLKKFRSLLKP